MTTPLLLPQPRQLRAGAGTCPIGGLQFISLDGPDRQALLFGARRLQAALRFAAGRQIELRAGPGRSGDIRISVAPGAVEHDQGYRLSITPTGVALAASSPAGAFYGICTLVQLVEQTAGELPCLEIADWPDFPVRGVMLDVSRDKVPTLATLLELADTLASWKINQLQLYTEHTFAYRDHPEVWAKASPLTGEDILILDAYCRERQIELVPNQNTFGHMRRWLNLPRYKELSEAPDGCDTIWGRFDEPFTLDPGNPDSLELVRGLLDDLLPHFSSTMVNIGADETVDLGLGQSAAAVAERGKGRVYLDFVLQLYQEVIKRGHTMQFWGDIIVEYPELVAELPRDAIALEWGYEADHPFDKHGALFAESGIPFYVCPGTSSWNSVAGRTENALENLRNAAANGRKHGAIGYLITDWGDNGHWQPLPVSDLGFAYGAALGWDQDRNIELDVPAALDRFAFRDQAGVLGRLAYDLGNVGRELNPTFHNNTVLFRVINNPENVPISEYLSLEALADIRRRIDEIIAPLEQARPARADAALLRREFAWAAALVRHAADHAEWQLTGDDSRRAALDAAARDLIAEYQAIWLERNRPGGLEDSAERFDTLAAEYGE